MTVVLQKMYVLLCFLKNFEVFIPCQDSYGSGWDGFI